MADTTSAGKSKAVDKPYDWSTAVASKEREELRPWHALGLIMHDLYGYTYKEVADRLRNGKGAETLRQVAQSPAGKRLKERVAELIDSPDKIAKLFIQASSLDVTSDFLVALEWAKEARDYRAVYAMTKDLLRIASVSEDSKASERPSAVHIHLSGGSLDAPIVKTDYEIVED
jgi:hypothetical protein